MKKLLFMSVLLASACTTVPIATPTTNTCVSNTVIDDKAFYAAEALYNVPAQAYLSLVKSGKLVGANKDAYKAKILQLRSLRDKVRYGHDACAMDALQLLSAQLKSALGVK